MSYKKIRQVTHFDLDGWGSWYPFHKLFRQLDYRYKFGNYKNLTEKVTWAISEEPDLIIITDLSLQKEQLELLLQAQKHGCDIMYFDHHQSTIKQLETMEQFSLSATGELTTTTKRIGALTGIIDTTKSASLIVYQYILDLLPQFKSPLYKLLYKYINDFDINSPQMDDNGRMVNNYFLYLDNDFFKFKNYVQKHSKQNYKTKQQVISNFVKQAEPSYEIMFNIYSKQLKSAFKNLIEWEKLYDFDIYKNETPTNQKVGLIILSDYNNLINRVFQKGTISKFFGTEQFGMPEDMECVAVYSINSKNISVRSYEKSNISARKIAQLFGGGGHQNASGFRVQDINTFNSLITK